MPIQNIIKVYMWPVLRAHNFMFNTNTSRACNYNQHFLPTTQHFDYPTIEQLLSKYIPLLP